MDKSWIYYSKMSPEYDVGVVKNLWSLLLKMLKALASLNVCLVNV